MTSINIALTLTLDVRLFNSSGRWLLTVRIEQFRCNGSTVGSQPDYEWNSPFTANYRFQSAIHSSLTTRIVLNIREAASQRHDDFSFNLHMSDANFHVPGSRISFAENPAVFHSNEDREDAISLRRRRPDSASAAQTGVVPISNSTAPHVTPPMAQDDKGERMVGLPEPGGGSDDGQDSMRTSPDQCM